MGSPVGVTARKAMPPAGVAAARIHFTGSSDSVTAGAPRFLRRKAGEYCESIVASSKQRPYQYSQFCELYRRHEKQVDVVMRQTHRAGEKLFVDYSGKRP